MFVESMSREEKAALLGALGYLASADGEFSHEEVSFLEVMASVLGLEASKVLTSEGRTLEEIIAPIQDPRHQRAAVIELVRLAWADEHFSEAEVGVIGQIAEIFQLDAKTLAAIKEWVQQELTEQSDGSPRSDDSTG
jgi:uncharacterized tellurite resistance protein B-like protein